MIVDSLMRRSIVALPVGATARAAARLMRERGIGSVVVVRGGVPVGMVTEGDLARTIVAEGRDADRTELADIMAHPVATIEPAASVEDAARRMKELRVKRLVVVLGTQVRGILSATDIAYAEPRLTEGLAESWVARSWQD